MTSNIIMCFDGTDNNFGKGPPSNIFELYKLLEKNAPNQHCFYQPGIGIDIDVSQTSFEHWSAFTCHNAAKNSLDSAIAFSIDYHVIQAYHYLIEKYKPNDKIYLFGFSRGSFVARILAGMIEKIGLLDNGLESMVKTAWEIYKSWERIGQPSDLSNPKHCSYSIKLFKQTFCRYDVSIEFMGLFDSINSCGIFIDRLFPYTSNTSNVKHIRHAVSIHERRSKFKQNLFVPHSYLPHFLNSASSSCSSLESYLKSANLPHHNDVVDSGPVDDQHSILSNFSLPDEYSITRPHQISVQFSKKCSGDLLEVWFPGDHSDIGGNWHYDNNGSKLSILSLRWILSYAVEYGVLFKKNSLDEFNSKFSPLKSSLAFRHDVLSFVSYAYPEFKSPYCSPEHDETGNSDLDISSPLSPNFPAYTTTNEPNTPNDPQDIDADDLLKNGKIDTFKGHGDESVMSTIFWWMLEVMPIGYLVENQHGKWRPLYWPNLGENRNIPFYARVHWSILWRMKFIKDDPNNYQHLPPIYKLIQKIVDNDGIPSEFSNETITIRLSDLVDLKTGVFRSDISSFITNTLKTNKSIKLDIDWKNPPNELSYRMKQKFRLL